MKRQPWTDRDERQLRVLHAAGKTVRSIAQALGRDRSVIKRRAKVSGLQFERQRLPFTAAEDQQLRARYENERTEDIASDLGRSARCVFNRANRLGLRKSRECIACMAAERSRQEDHGGRRTRFQKGLVPANKGIRRPGWAPGRMAETQFRAGELNGSAAQKLVPVGTEVVDRDGYRKRKVRDDAPPNLSRRNWAFVHVLVWMEHHGEIPAGHAVIFKNGNKADIRIDNLELVTRQELMRRNSYHNRYPKEVGLAIQLRGQIIRQINKRARREKQD